MAACSLLNVLGMTAPNTSSFHLDVLDERELSHTTVQYKNLRPLQTYVRFSSVDLDYTNWGSVKPVPTSSQLRKERSRLHTISKLL